MTESKLHRTIKNGVAQALLQDGFNVKTEYAGIKDEGRIDVYAEKPDGELVKVEVVKTHVPNWLLIKLGGNHKNQRKMHNVAVSREHHELLLSMKKGFESMDDVIGRLLKSVKTQKTETTN